MLFHAFRCWSAGYISADDAFLQVDLLIDGFVKSIRVFFVHLQREVFQRKVLFFALFQDVSGDLVSVTERDTFFDKEIGAVGGIQIDFL